MTTMRLRFDPSLSHQHEAIAAVTDLFHGLPLANGPLTFSVTGTGLPITEYGVSNAVSLDDDTLLTNLRAVQDRNEIAQVSNIDERRFAVEMETGTGKTYVYLRTIFELHKLYGLKKFVIVVPSVPIREGVLHSIDTMREHFRSLYDVPFDHFVYDSSRLTQIRSFAMANTIQIMVINIQAFIKDIDAKDTGRGAGNVIYREFDKLNGMRPIEYIQHTNPVVIVDEPQRVQAEKSQQALKRLNPLVTLEYSATFESPNKVYRLGPIEAYEQKLVKQIEVASVVQEEDANTAYVRLIKADIAGKRTQVEITAGGVTDPKRRRIWIRQGDDLEAKSDRRPEYRHGFRVTSLGWEAGNEFIEFSGGLGVTPSTPLGEMTDDIMRAQIETTIRQHFERERTLSGQGIKVLSLFFIDRVANYRDYDEAGNPQPGKIARWFEDIYADLRNRYPDTYGKLDHPPVERLHDGYFSVDKQKRARDTTGKTQGDDDTYELIMRDKERLLTLDESLRFIFSHSALREGWDNPNVFQICTLNETRSVEKKRQEIGRGLRLPVNQGGERIHDPNINRLTVVANESYREFAETLQREYEQDAGIRFGIVPRTAFNNVTVPADVGSEPVRIEQAGSERISTHLRHNGYLDWEGEIQPRFVPDQLWFRDAFPQSLPEEYRNAGTVDQIVEAIRRYMFRDRVVTPVRKRRDLNVNERVLDNQEFLDFWNQVAQRTRFIVEFDSERLIAEAAQNIRNRVRVTPPKIRVNRSMLEQTRAGIKEGAALYSDQIESQDALVIPDIITMIQGETNLTRNTITQILLQSGKAEDIRVNPQSFITQATAIIVMELKRVMQGGLKYEKRDGDVWHVRRFRGETPSDLNVLEDRLYRVQNPERTVYDGVEFDSTIESSFVARLDTDQRVKFYVKLPSWFTVDTPIGKYNPDWAIMMEDGEKFYLVRETKGSLLEAKRRGTENAKIEAARKHFTAIDVDYDVSQSFSEVSDTSRKSEPDVCDSTVIAICVLERANTANIPHIRNLATWQP